MVVVVAAITPADGRNRDDEPEGSIQEQERVDLQSTGFQCGGCR